MARKKIVPVEVSNSVGDALKSLIDEGQKVIRVDDVLQQHIKSIKEAAKRGNSQKEILERLQSAGLEIGLTKFREWCAEKNIEFHVGAPKGKRKAQIKREPKVQTEQKHKDDSSESTPVQAVDERQEYSQDLTRTQTYRNTEQ